MNKRGFTLIELVMVIVIIGILAAIALPRFVDLTGQAEQAATRGGLGAIRAAAAIRYAQNATAGGNPSFPALSASDFVGGQLPTNVLNDQSAISHTNATVSGTASSNLYGWWYITGTGTDAGRCGAYSGDEVNTSSW